MFFLICAQGRKERSGKGGTISQAPNHCEDAERCGGRQKSQQYHKYILQYSTFASERPHFRTWGCQTCFLPQVQSNLVTPLSALIKNEHTAHMYRGIKTLKHNMRTTLRLAYHSCKNLTHTSKTRQVKRTVPKWLQLLGSRSCLFRLLRIERKEAVAQKEVIFKPEPLPETFQ